MRAKFLLSFFLLFISCASFAFSAEQASLQYGVEQYQKENFEEAIEVFTKARVQDPASSMAAFLLGMS